MKDSFCSSPWFHIRIDPAGYYVPCRWFFNQVENKYHVKDYSLIEYLRSDIMAKMRKDMLNAEPIKNCSSCLYQDKHNKISGRQRQLLKSGIDIEHFNKTLCSSPHFKNFEYSYNSDSGKTITQPVDLQIDLGNTCNSSCIMCYPKYSSRVMADYAELHEIEPDVFAKPTPLPNWTNDPALVDKFINELVAIPNIKYIHFLGGETLYMKSFYDICDRLIESGAAKDLSIGTTTNCTIYDKRIERIIENFKHVHLGLSIDAVTDLNDYIRYPSKIDSVLDYADKFLALRGDKLQISMRITPTIFSIWHIDKLFEYLLEHRVIAESCNILQDPNCLRIELLPKNLRKQVIGKIESVIKKHNLIRTVKEINVRREDNVDAAITNVIFEYLDFLKKVEIFPITADNERDKLIKFIRAYETLRNNKITDYLPEYEEFLRSHNY